MPKKKLSQAPVTGALAERQRPDGRRRITLRAQERDALLRRQRAEAAAALFLDLESHRTWDQVARELGISPSQLRDLTKSQEFDEAYNALFAETGHDPRFRATQSALADMLPVAVTRLRSLLLNDRTSPAVLLKAIQLVMQLNGVNAPDQKGGERQELARFLTQNNIQINHFEVPGEYLAAERLVQPESEVEVVEGEAVPMGE